DGIGEEHMDPVGRALDRRRLAVAARTADRQPVLLGRAEPEARRVWEALARLGRAADGDLAGCVGGDRSTCREWLARLEGRRLIRAAGGAFESLFVMLAAGDAGGEDARA